MSGDDEGEEERASGFVGVCGISSSLAWGGVSLNEEEGWPPKGEDEPEGAGGANGGLDGSSADMNGEEVVVPPLCCCCPKAEGVLEENPPPPLPEPNALPLPLPNTVVPPLANAPNPSLTSARARRNIHSRFGSKSALPKPGLSES